VPVYTLCVRDNEAPYTTTTEELSTENEPESNITVHHNEFQQPQIQTVFTAQWKGRQCNHLVLLQSTMSEWTDLIGGQNENE